MTFASKFHPKIPGKDSNPRKKMRGIKKNSFEQLWELQVVQKRLYWARITIFPWFSANLTRPCWLFAPKESYSFNPLSVVQKKIFLTKLKGHPNLFVTGKFLYSQYRNKEENIKGTKNLFLYRQIFVIRVFVTSIFDCTYKKVLFNPL